MYLVPPPRIDLPSLACLLMFVLQNKSGQLDYFRDDRCNLDDLEY